MSTNPIFDAACALVAASRLAQHYGRERFGHIHAAAYAREFGTLRVAGPRGAGHTEAAIRLGREVFAGNAILVPYLPMPHGAAEAFKEVVKAGDLGDPGRFRGRSIDALIVDAASGLMPDQVDRLYAPHVLECFSHAKHRFIVLLG